MSWSLAVVAEARADRATAAGLVTRVVRHDHDWVEPEYLTFRGFRPDEPLLRWQDVKAVAGQNRVTVAGFMRGAPPSPDAHTAFRALLLFARCLADGDKVDAVLLIRDSDGDRARRHGLEQAREVEPWPFAVVIGVAHTKRECWHVAGFEPADDLEREAVAGLTAELGPDFRRRTEELTAKHDSDKRSAKRVLDVLTVGDPDRERRCLTGPPLDVLKDRGERNGLNDFIEEVEARLVPLFAHRPPA